MIYILIKAEWSPIAYNCWKDSQGSLWMLMGKPVSPDIVSAAIAKTHVDLDCQRAESHYNGLGLKEGLHIEASLKVHRNFKETHYKEKCVLETIMCSGCWSGSRINAIKPSFDPICKRCD